MKKPTIEDVRQFILVGLQAGGLQADGRVQVKVFCLRCETQFNAANYEAAACPQCGPVDLDKGVRLELKRIDA